ncbi:MAG: dTDP-4-dehydrorhamnose 3,5-epimerase family protein [Candidatus Riflebacteria bacterium]|nr:dTDP-4-dehydrorhamnose 3,5-epimerase family protein [Candidatus Riflebacteria bacterium]
MSLKPQKTSIEGVLAVDTDQVSDSRGSFARLFCQNELLPILGNRQILQINRSRTARTGAIRGIHYQLPPHAEMKLIRCLKGRVLDIAVDLRADSPTFLKWHAEELSAINCRMLVVPEGCGHGFQVLEPDSELLYLHTSFYRPDCEGGVRFDDPLLAINWPIEPCDLSTRDQNHPLLRQNFEGIQL